MTPLCEKYRPVCFEDIKGQDEAVSKIKFFFEAFKNKSAKKNALLFHGPAGTGKTSLAHTLAKEMDLELFELNASDLRNRAKLEEVLKPAIEQQSLFSKGKIILVDEVDGVTATDRGGLPELIKLIEETKFPMIITCNDIWQQKFSKLRQKCELVQLKELKYEYTIKILSEILTKENKTIPEQLLATICLNARGDIRAALNDLQAVIGTETPSDSIDKREKQEDIFHVMQKLFKSKTDQDTPKIFENLNENLDEVSLWIEENIPLEYQGEELAKAYEALSKADVFKGRIYRQQHWRFMVYQNFFLSVGISAARKDNQTNSSGFTRYQRSKKPLKIWLAKNKNMKKTSISAKFAKFVHIGKKRAMQDFPIYSLFLDEPTIKKLNLSDQEIEFLQEFRKEHKMRIRA